MPAYDNGAIGGSRIVGTPRRRRCSSSGRQRPGPLRFRWALVGEAVDSGTNEERFGVDADGEWRNRSRRKVIMEGTSMAVARSLRRRESRQ
ncbi:MAG: hypothetical protein OEM62_07260 [Acidobacteriota bacterium]|nr:hypothetical protein [Acidobacteriota bacterium]